MLPASKRAPSSVKDATQRLACYGCIHQGTLALTIWLCRSTCKAGHLHQARGTDSPCRVQSPSGVLTLSFNWYFSSTARLNTVVCRSSRICRWTLKCQSHIRHELCNSRYRTLQALCRVSQPSSLCAGQAGVVVNLGELQKPPVTDFKGLVINPILGRMLRCSRSFRLTTICTPPPCCATHSYRQSSHLSALRRSSGNYCDSTTYLLEQCPAPIGTIQRHTCHPETITESF